MKVNSACLCSGMWGPYGLQIVDTLQVHPQSSSPDLLPAPSPLCQVPASLPPGDYVLGWRWDCEESTQVYQPFPIL